MFILNENRILNSENGLRRLPITREKELMEKIRMGKYKEIKEIDYKKLDTNMGVNVKDDYKKFEYITVALISGETRAAIEGGLPPDDAFDISEAMLTRLEWTKTIEELQNIADLSAKVFAHEVLLKRQKNSYMIGQCKNYISRNIYKKIYLKDIAEYVGRNPSYVSRLFSQDQGITLQQYIQKEKINVACNLLKYSNRSIAEIAQYMGFCSQSNFTDAFKRWKSLSPNMYRNQNQQAQFVINE